MRDVRDPQLLGEALLSLRRGSRGKLSLLYDQNHGRMNAVPAYTGEGEGIAIEQAVKYTVEHPDGLPTDSDPAGN